jgi:hypothetical protein
MSACLNAISTPESFFPILSLSLSYKKLILYFLLTKTPTFVHQFKTPSFKYRATAVFTSWLNSLNTRTYCCGCRFQSCCCYCCKLNKLFGFYKIKYKGVFNKNVIVWMRFRFLIIILKSVLLHIVTLQF